MNAELVIDFLLTALDHIDQRYYGNRISPDNYGVPLGDPRRPELEEFLSRFGERYFCYELYHRIRSQIEKFLESIPEDERNKTIVFQGELKKENIRNMLDLFPDIVALQKEYIPDFLLHSPGNFDHQELVIEVKSNPSISTGEVKNDLLKIQEFITRYRYRLGVFLTVNSDSNRVINMLRDFENTNWLRQNLTDRNRIFVIQKESQDSDTTLIRLDSIPEA